MDSGDIPAIGKPLSEGEKIYFEFIEKFQDAVEACCETGQEARMLLNFGDRSVVVHVFEAGKETKKFDELIQAAAKGEIEVKIGGKQ